MVESGRELEKNKNKVKTDFIEITKSKGFYSRGNTKPSLL